jgi:hypothetical protein
MWELSWSFQELTSQDRLEDTAGTGYCAGTGTGNGSGIGTGIGGIAVENSTTGPELVPVQKAQALQELGQDVREQFPELLALVRG